MKTLKVGDYVDVEIAGTAIGDAVISEITDEYVEYVFMGRPYRLGADSLEYFDLFDLYA